MKREQHRMKHTKVYEVWCAMKARCYNKNNKDYLHYGGRGIKVCDEWKNSFTTFLKDMGNRPNKMTLDRINNNDDYKPSNCRWVSMQRQCSNRRNNIIYKGETAAEASRRLNGGVTLVRNRIREGMPIEKAFTQPKRNGNYRNKIT